MKDIVSFRNVRDCGSYYLQVYREHEYFYSKRYGYELGFYSKVEGKLYFNKWYKGYYEKSKRDIKNSYLGENETVGEYLKL